MFICRVQAAPGEDPIFFTDVKTGGKESSCALLHKSELPHGGRVSLLGDQRRKINKVEQAFILQQRLTTHVGAASLPALDEAFCFQLAHDFPDRGSADIETLCKRRL